MFRHAFLLSLLLAIISPSLSRTYVATSVRSSSRSPKIEDTPPTEDPNLPHKRLISSINKFSNRLYNMMHEYKPEDSYETTPESEDLVYSPVCIFTSLSTLQSGSKHETKQELSTILSLTKINDTVTQEGLNSILNTYEHTENSKVNILNRVFLDHSFHPANRYVNTIRDKFHSELVQTHFSNATAASIFVNKHVYTASHGVLQDVITVESPDQEPNGVTENSGNLTQYQTQSIDGGLMLISGVTFEGEWERPFTPLLTTPEQFEREDGSRTTVEMMHRDGVYLHAEIPELNATALNIVYTDYRYSFNILLPEEGTTLSQLEENLESFPCIAVLSRLKKQYMQVSLPKFQVETTVDLIDPLEKLGIRRVFSEHDAQMGRMVDGVEEGELYLTNAVHKVVISVSEGGSRVKSQNFIEAIPAKPRVRSQSTGRLSSSSQIRCSTQS